jgi:hypothetical protein
MPTGFAFDRQPGPKRVLANAMENDPRRPHPSEQRIAGVDFLDERRFLSSARPHKRLK